MAKSPINKDLLTQIKQAKKSRRFFAIVLKGGADGALIVSRRNITPGDISEAKKASGGTKVIQGVCYGEDDGLVFETPKVPPGTLSNVIKKVVKRDAGLQLKVQARMAPEEDADEQDQKDPLLTAGLKQAKKAKRHFAVVLKGGADGALAVSRKKITPNQINEMKQKSGGSKIIKGVVFGEDANHIFETPKVPPGTLAKVLKLIAKRDAGLMIKPICRMAQSETELPDEFDEVVVDETETSTTSEPSQSTTPEAPKRGLTPKQQWNRRLSAATPTLKEALSTDGDISDIKLKFSQAQALARSGAYIDALDMLAEAEESAQRLLGTEEAEDEHDDSTQRGRWLHLLDQSTPRLTEAIKVGGPSVKEIKTRFSEARTLARKEDFEAAITTLQQVLELAEEATSGVEETSDLDIDEITPDSPSGEDESATDQAEFQRQFAEWKPRYNAVRGTPSGESNGVADVYNQTVAKARGKDFAGALESLETLKARIRSAERATRVQDELSKAAGVNNVAYVRSRVAWLNARSTAASEVAKLRDAILGDNETQGYDDFSEIQKGLSNVDWVLEDFDHQLEDALSKAGELSLTAEPAKAYVARSQVATLIADYHQKLQSNELLKNLDATDYGTFNIYGVLDTALSAMARQLKV